MSDEQPSIEAAEAEPQPEKKDDGSIVVRLVTDLGEADITVPPRARWRSTARNRLSSQDDLGWAAGTLSDDDVKTWIDLDPVWEDVENFFTELNRLSPDTNRADRRRRRQQ